MDEAAPKPAAAAAAAVAGAGDGMHTSDRRPIFTGKKRKKQALKLAAVPM
jgi:hypothetical protein